MNFQDYFRDLKDINEKKIKVKVGDKVKLFPIYFTNMNTGEKGKMESPVYKVLGIQDDLAEVQNIEDKEKIIVTLDMIEEKL